MFFAKGWVLDLSEVTESSNFREIFWGASSNSFFSDLLVLLRNHLQSLDHYFQIPIPYH